LQATRADCLCRLRLVLVESRTRLEKRIILDRMFGGMRWRLNLLHHSTFDMDRAVKIAFFYVYPVPANGAPFARLADRFVSTYRDNPPMMDHMMVVVSNGGLPNGLAYKQFSFIEGTKFIHHDNIGYDIGAFQSAARSVICDLMV